MHPIERLRYVARAGETDPTFLAQEAAEALGSLAFDPRALVPACRRLIEFHPTCAPLWWVCARLLSTADVAGAAERAIEQLADDPTVDELAATFPAGAVVATDGGETALAALGMRPDLTVRVVAGPSALRYQLRRMDGDVTGYDLSEADEALDGASLAVVEPLAAGPDGVLMREDGAGLVAEARRADIDVWAVTGEGRILPGALFGALCRHVGAVSDDAAEDEELFEPARRAARRSRPTAPTVVVSARELVAVVGPFGAQHAPVALSHVSCAAPTELLDPSRGMEGP